MSGWQAPGEGYIPDPMELHHLKEIDIKLQALLSDRDFSAISISHSKLPSQIYQVHYRNSDFLFEVCVEI